jgi:RNA polymerase sigma factor (sigma-70 family)
VNTRSDSQLLREYVERGSEVAFSEIVRRHVDLVHSAAVRMVRDGHLAEDVTQRVFVALAKNGGRLTDCRALCGWLHRTAQNIAAETVRTDVRRRAREREAATMNEILASDADATWERIAPDLDGALGELSETERDAVLLRYFEKKSAQEMAQVLGVSTEAAQKRVNRAVERLRELFVKRGVAVGAGGLAAVITANGVQAAPVGLAASAAAMALAGPVISASASIAVTKTIGMITLQKAAIASAIIIVAGAGIYDVRQNSRLRNQVEGLQQEKEQMTVANQRLQETNDQLQTDATRLRADSQALQQVKQEDDAAANDPTQKAMLSWLDRVDRLKRRLEQTPGALIPEMQWLSEQDWLNAASGKLETDEDYRRAFSSLRGTAENEFSFKAFPALQKYMNANNGAFPTDLSQLEPYFDAPVDASILQRWQIVPASQEPNFRFGGDYLITQKAAVDDEMDAQIGIGPSGYGSAGNGFNPEMKTLQSVAAAFAAANPGQTPTDVADLLPYATTREQQAAIQKQMEMQQNDPRANAATLVLKAFAAANPGREPKSSSELLPYATTPEQQAAVRGMILQPPAGR